MKSMQQSIDMRDKLVDLYWFATLDIVHEPNSGTDETTANGTTLGTPAPK